MSLEQLSPLPRAPQTHAAPAHATLTRPVTLLFATTAGFAVANVYYAQPLLDTLAHQFDISRAAIGGVMTITSICYGLGLLLLVPLGDLWDRRKMILIQSVVCALALLSIATATRASVLFAGMALIGFLSVVTQVLVSFAAGLAEPAERGQVVGTVTSGIVLGILLARTFSGAIADLAGWRAVYFTSAGVMLLLAVVLSRVLPHHRLPGVAEPYPRLIASVFTLFAQERVLRVRAFIAFLHFAAAMTLWTPMVLPLSAPPLSLSHTEIGLFGLAGAAGALGAARAGRLADRGLAQWTSGIGLALMLVSWLPTALMMHSLVALVVGVVAFDLGLQAVHVTNQSLIYGVRPDARSRLTAGYMLLYAAGCASGSIASTYVYARFGWAGVCTLGAAFSATALLFWYATLRPRA
ncbi:major facilitator transporter [Burkholderia lata]|uniref:Major facilitator transporter n=1 Tax=Burkholderia lata (strain ATCC 17760 / DSM 23089 / LMG 22485 / NCIMB 9086 / R18194 / 383) TaxID=482957 RepID=A0A6P2YE30_BURL3|nr:MFS transporter [Burkholderia lata]VWD18798.1 major facilitator transporter [Burkholderia lata]